MARAEANPDLWVGEVNRGYYRTRIPPGFRGRPVAAIARRDVRAWFASLDAVPATADRRLPILPGHTPVGAHRASAMTRAVEAPFADPFPDAHGHARIG